MGTICFNILPGYQYVYNSDSVNKLVITDEDYLYYFVDHIDEIDVSKDILLDGYYQFDRYIMSILNVDNHERINNTYLVSDIYIKYLHKLYQMKH